MPKKKQEGLLKPWGNIELNILQVKICSYTVNIRILH